MSYVETGWEPETRVRRSVVLPEPLDDELALRAQQERSTPSAVVSQALTIAVSNGDGAGNGGQPDLRGAERYLERADRVQRIIVLDSDVNEALDHLASRWSMGFSVLATSLVDRFLRDQPTATGD